MNKPTVSIILSTYNDADYLREAIDSVLSQSFTDWEFIIINDASEDNTEMIINSYCKYDKRFRYFLNKENKGQTINLNKALAIAQGEFIARIDGDDIWTDKNKLQKQVDFLTHNKDYGLVGTWWITIDSKGEKVSEFTYPTSDKNIRDYILIENCFTHSSVVIAKSVLDTVGHYSNEYYWAQDYDLWLRIGKISKFCNIPEFMVSYRINPNGMTQTNYQKQLQNTYEIVKLYKSDYPNFMKGYILWKLRIYFPRWIREQVSRRLR